MQNATSIGFLAGVVTLIGLVISVGAARAAAQEPHDAVKPILMGLAIWATAYFSWRSFRIQRRAEKLRQRPTPAFHRFIDPNLPGETPKD